MNFCSTTYIEHPVPIKHGSLSRPLEKDLKIIDYFLDLKEKGEGVFSTNGEGWKTDWYTHMDHQPVLKELVDNVCEWYVKNISSPRNNDVHNFLKTVDNIELDANVWFAEYLKGNISNQHHHGNYPKISFVYYLQVEDNGSPLTFVQQKMDDYGDLEFVGEINLPTYNGMLVMFPPFLHHKVYPTVGKRYVVAGNINDMVYNVPLNENN